MKYAIELYFDHETEQKLFEYPKLLDKENLSSKYLEWKTRPHVTLACFNDVDEEKCRHTLADFASSHAALFAYIGSLGFFTDTRTIFASPVMNSSMYDIQREIHGMMSDFDTSGHEWYLPDRWVPHCGLALMSEDDDEAFFKASDLILRRFEKIAGKFSSIGLVKISFPVEEIFTVDLQG